MTQDGSLAVDITQCGISTKFNWDRMRWYRFRPKIYMPNRSEFRWFIKHITNPITSYQDIYLTYPDFLDRGGSSITFCRIREWSLAVKKRYWEWPCQYVGLNPATPGTLFNNPSQKFYNRQPNWNYRWWLNVEYEIIYTTFDDNDYVGLMNMN